MAQHQDADTPPLDVGTRLKTWVARHGRSVNFFLAAEVTFARVVEQAAEGTDDTAGSLATARQRMLDAAAIVAAADPIPDASAAELLHGVLRGVEELAALTSPDGAPAGLPLARQMLVTEQHFADLLQRLLDLQR